MRLPDGNGPLVLYARDTRRGAGPRILGRLPCLFPARDHKRNPSPVLNNRRRLAARTLVTTYVGAVSIDGSITRGGAIPKLIG
jgi:hypothetical protein